MVVSSKELRDLLRRNGITKKILHQLQKSDIDGAKFCKLSEEEFVKKGAIDDHLRKKLLRLQARMKKDEQEVIQDVPPYMKKAADALERFYKANKCTAKYGKAQCIIDNFADNPALLHSEFKKKYPSKHKDLAFLGTLVEDDAAAQKKIEQLGKKLDAVYKKAGSPEVGKGVHVVSCHTDSPIELYNLLDGNYPPKDIKFIADWAGVKQDSKTRKKREKEKAEEEERKKREKEEEEERQRELQKEEEQKKKADAEKRKKRKEAEAAKERAAAEEAAKEEAELQRQREEAEEQERERIRREEELAEQESRSTKPTSPTVVDPTTSENNNNNNNNNNNKTIPPNTNTTSVEDEANAARQRRKQEWEAHRREQERLKGEEFDLIRQREQQAIESHRAKREALREAERRRTAEKMLQRADWEVPLNEARSKLHEMGHTLQQYAIREEDQLEFIRELEFERSLLQQRLLKRKRANCSKATQCDMKPEPKNVRKGPSLGMQQMLSQQHQQILELQRQVLDADEESNRLEKELRTLHLSDKRYQSQARDAQNRLMHMHQAQISMKKSLADYSRNTYHSPPPLVRVPPPRVITVHSSPIKSPGSQCTCNGSVGRSPVASSYPSLHSVMEKSPPRLVVTRSPSL
eukprot:TRINITY_DN5103_c0_g1_i1.p1 TRINITY_DN5103_c0_g1~~TRINITY_DN5103_c0_g1_i1.p1  ORF type:complete len:635 (+),score=189.25 TRINITY_DN5103_c0_g1_i1:110-2014(+)